MDKYEILKRDGSELTCNGYTVYVRKGEVESTFMGQDTLTFSLKSAYPVAFEPGCYVTIDGNKYTLNYEPSCKKQSRSGTYGEGYVYDNIVMNGESDKLTRIEFLDFVLEDNEIHYSNMPTVYFFGGVSGLLDRIKANLDRVYPDEWTIETVGTLNSQEKQITFSNITVWEALTKVWEEFDCLFYIRGHVITVGTKNDLVSKVFEYGKGKGLKSIKPVTSESNAIITRLHAYGSRKNMPYRYYNASGKTLKPDLQVTLTRKAATLNYRGSRPIYDIFFVVDGAPVGMFNMEGNTLVVVGTSGGTTYTRTITPLYNTYNGMFDIETTDASEAEIYKDILNGGTATITQSSIDVTKTPTAWLSVGGFGVSESMYLPNLMLPVIRNSAGTTIYYNASFGVTELVGGVWSNGTGKYKQVREGSANTLDIYLESIDGVAKFGIMEASITFDNNTDDNIVDLVDDENGIYPHLTDNNTLTSAQQMEDEGIIDSDGSCEPKVFWVDVTLPFNPSDYLTDETMMIAFKSGKMVGRQTEFSCEAKGSGVYRLTCNRVFDTAMGYAFPNKSYQLKAGDEFVLLGIKMPDSYVEAAEGRLLSAGLKYLANIDHSKYTYEPELDNIFLATNATSAGVLDYSNGIASELVAGNVFRVKDTDVIGENTISLPISSVKMGFGDEMLRKYDIVLTDTPDIKSDIVTRTVSAVKGSLAVAEASSSRQKTRGTTTVQGDVSWDNVLDKPSTFPPSSHDHDDRYYTEAEIDEKMLYKADLVHTHDASDVTTGTFTTARIPNLSASKITYGTFDAARIPKDIDITGNADTATKLETARTLWGQSFDGSGDVSGSMDFADGAAIRNLESLELYSGDTSVNHGGHLDFHYKRSSGDYSARIINDGENMLSLDFDSRSDGRFRVLGNSIQLGDFILEATSDGLKITKADGTPANIYTTGEVTAYKSNS